MSTFILSDIHPGCSEFMTLSLCHIFKVVFWNREWQMLDVWFLMHAFFLLSLFFISCEWNADIACAGSSPKKNWNIISLRNNKSHSSYMTSLLEDNMGEMEMGNSDVPSCSIWRLQTNLTCHTLLCYTNWPCHLVILLFCFLSCLSAAAPLSLWLSVTRMPVKLKTGVIWMKMGSLA